MYNIYHFLNPSKGFERGHPKTLGADFHDQKSPIKLTQKSFHDRFICFLEIKFGSCEWMCLWHKTTAQWHYKSKYKPKQMLAIQFDHWLVWNAW